MYRAYFDIPTVLLYVLVGILGYLCVREFMKPCYANSGFQHAMYKRRNKTFEITFILLYTLLAVSRLVSIDIGGSDAIDYVENFKNILSGGLDRKNNAELEPGFLYFTRVIRIMTDSYKTYFFVVYGFISWGYVTFIKKNCPKGLCYIPFILLMYPFLKSFTSIRSSIAVGIILLGLTQIDNRKWLSLIILLSSLLFHRMSLLFVLIWPFYFVMKGFLEKNSRMRFVVITLAGVAVTFVAATMVQQYVLIIGLFDDSTTNYYLTASMGQNIFTRYPMFIGQLMLWGAVVVLFNIIKWDKKSVLLRTLFVYDIWMIPVGLVLGMWRSIEYFYTVRLSLWCLCIFSFTRKQSKEIVVIMKTVAALLFIFWLYFRVYKEWDDAKLSPYIFDLF